VYTGVVAAFPLFTAAILEMLWLYVHYAQLPRDAPFSTVYGGPTAAWDLVGYLIFWVVLFWIFGRPIHAAVKQRLETYEICIE
jgi:hypothetical protein